VFEGRCVPASRQANDDRIAAACAYVVLIELCTQAARFDPDDRVEPRIVPVGPIEDLGPDDVFLQPVTFSRQRAVHDVAQKTPEAI
jgi:hypothetical protein